MIQRHTETGTVYVEITDDVYDRCRGFSCNGGCALATALHAAGYTDATTGTWTATIRGSKYRIYCGGEQGFLIQHYRTRWTGIVELRPIDQDSPARRDG